MSIERLYARIVEDTHIWNSPIHGTEHWMRVRDNALYLAKHNNGDPKVVEYFAILHDCQRWNEDLDPEHGPRAADYAKTQRSLIDLSDEQFALLQRACAGHTHAKPETTRNPTLPSPAAGMPIASILDAWASNRAPVISSPNMQKAWSRIYDEREPTPYDGPRGRQIYQ
jgi:hypothetical protein